MVSRSMIHHSATRQNKARYKMVFSAQPDEEDIGLKGKTCIKHYLTEDMLMH